MFWRSVTMRRAPSTKLLLVCLIFVCFLFYFKSSTSDSDSANAVNSKVVISGKLLSAHQLNGNTSIDRNAWSANTNRNSADDFDEFEREIQLDLRKQIRGLGDDGKAAELTNKASKEIGERQLATISLNEELSEHLSYNRTLQDARNPLCRKQHFDVDTLPTVSVIIIFFNEPYSVLVRTIHSVLNTCDRRLLKEVIIVDDCSTAVELKGKLDYYIQTRFPANMVKTIRLKHR